MPSEIALAKRKGVATERLAALRTELAELAGVPPLAPPPQQREPEFMRVQEVEAMADFLESLKPGLKLLKPLGALLESKAEEGEDRPATLQRLLNEQGDAMVKSAAAPKRTIPKEK